MKAKIALAVVIPFLVIAGFVAYFFVLPWVEWVHMAESAPMPVVPTPKMPASNAFDDYLAASRLLVRGEDVWSAAEYDPDKVFTLEKKKTLIAANAPALSRLAPGLGKPYFNPPVRTYDPLLPYYQQFRNLACLLSLKGQVDCEEGKWADAANCGLDAIQIGASIPHDSPLIGWLVGGNSEMIGRKPLWLSIDHLNAKQTKNAIARLDRIQKNKVRLDEVFQQEEWSEQAGLMDLGRTDRRYRGLSGNAVVRASLIDYTKYMNQLVAIYRRPYARRTAPPSPPTYSLAASLVWPAHSFASLESAINFTTSDFLIVSLALHAYKLDHGNYPEALSMLVPTYVPAVPSDPFAVGAPLRYRRERSGYVLYSVGPDGEDNGGRPIINPQYKGDGRYEVNADSKGDIVAGVNAGRLGHESSHE